MAFTSFSLTLFVLNFAIHSSLLLFNVASSVQASSIFPNNRFLHHSTEQKISKFINDNLTQHLSTATGIQEPFNDLFSGDGADNLVFRDDIKDAIPEGDAPHKFPFIAEGLEWPVVNDERFPFSENEDRDWTSEEDDDSSYWPSLEDVDVDDKDDGDDDNKVWANEDDHPKWSTDYVIANLSSERRLQELSTLSALFVVTRHGARTPTYYFSEDPNNELWTDGKGQLTNIGKRQLYFYGQEFRNQYDGFLNDVYDPKEVSIQSTPKDRTIMSAQCFLAGLYPPKTSQLWNQDLNWQPIPVYLQNYDVDALARKASKLLSDNCTANKQLSTYEKFSRYKSAITAIENATRFQGFLCGSFDLLLILDLFEVENYFNLTLPFGLESKVKDILELKNTVMSVMFGARETASLTNRPMFLDILSKIKGHVNSTVRQKAHFYFVHDINIMGMLSLLTNATVRSEFSSSIIIELHKGVKSGGFTIKVFFRETPHDKPEQQYIKKCGYHCPLNEFIKIIHKALVKPDYFRCPC